MAESVGLQGDPLCAPGPGIRNPLMMKGCTAKGRLLIHLP